ncbi:MAG: hypothetical protein RLZZ347_511 [Candidatus Parcubacteria bacterium]|jgi:hypothetical protein
MKKFTLIEILVILSLGLFLLWKLGPFPGCLVSEKHAISALEKAGYSEVKITDRSNYFISRRGGGYGDVTRFTCSAKNPAGKNVSDIYVFSGWPFKGTTIRMD